MRERLPCAACHSINGAGGRVGPELKTVLSRRSPTYVAAIIADPQAVLPGTVMPRVPMTTELRALVISYLTGDTVNRASGLTGPTAETRSASSPALTASAPAVYRRYCAPCHGETGGGDGPNARFLPVRPAKHSDAAFMHSRTDGRLFDAIFAGGYPLGRSSAMPAYGETLPREEIHDLVRYLRVLCRCAAPAWSTDGSSAMRDSTTAPPR